MEALGVFAVAERPLSALSAPPAYGFAVRFRGP